MPFLDSLDIGNRALFHLGLAPIASITENSKRNQVISFLYDKVRRAELRRNVWRFSCRRCAIRPLSTTSLTLQPEQWQNNVVYLPGAIVQDANGSIWLSTLADNLNNAPGATAAWDQYFGPMSVDQWINPGSQAQLQSGLFLPLNVAYFAGELAYLSNVGLPGSFAIFQSRTNSNTETPNVADAWSATTQYGYDDVVVNNNFLWKSLIAINIGNTPANGPLAWNATVTYAQNVQVTGSDGFIYTSLVSGNLNIDPRTDNGVHWSPTGLPNAWIQIPTLFGGIGPSNTWLPIYGGLSNLTFTYPIGTGPLSQTLTRNAFRLPAGFLRRAPDDPKEGSVSFLGAPSGNRYDDWILEGNFIVSREGNPIILRFAADVTYVPAMDDMFCEGLACRLAMDACEDLTQSSEKKNFLLQMYNKYMSEAREVNGIEMSPTEPPEDDYITCRY